jgi:hypothetical protein
MVAIAAELQKYKNCQNRQKWAAELQKSPRYAEFLFKKTGDNIAAELHCKKNKKS